MGISDTGSAGVGTYSFEEATYRRLTWRLVPFLFLCYIVAYLDRVNVGFAKLQMLGDLQLSETVYGLGAGIFFIGYFLFEVPSNIILHKVGARIWIARIMLTWGVLSAAMMFIATPMQFYILRFLLGLAEAGFFPGIILYLTYWFPAARRGRIVALFMTAVAIAGVVGGPLSGLILKVMEGVNGWRGWQWMFLLEGIPSIVVGLVALVLLDDRIADAKWLSGPEKTLINAAVSREQQTKQDHSLGQVFSNGKVWLMGLIYFCFVMGLYGISFWLPTLIKALGVKDLMDVGLLTAIPYAFAAVAMVMVGRSSDRLGERRWHIAVPGFLGAAGLVLSVLFTGNPVLAMAALTLGTAGILSTLPLFWSLPTAFLGGTAAAAGIAMINSLGNLAGYLSPTLVGMIKDATHSTDNGMYMLAACLVLGSVLTLSVSRDAVNPSQVLPA
ncbi:MFS transporter [Undibacterium sp. TJN25]|uniref:MFS transporter n=1 Tax=Undibacterium sp. TJN25 TaxID=3413056 RepID=UPI003BF13EDF